MTTPSSPVPSRPRGRLSTPPSLSPVDAAGAVQQHGSSVFSNPALKMTSSNRSESHTQNHEVFNTTVPSDNVTSNDILPPLEPREWRRQRDRNRYALMSVQKKEELLKKRCEDYQRSKDAKIARNSENIASDAKTVEQKSELTDEQLESRRAKDRKRYANMTPKQRQAIRDRQNARNMKPEQKQVKKDQYKARRELRRNTLHKDSIAMVNPRYNPMEDSP